MEQSIRNQLLALADEEYQKFSSGLIPNAHNILGVRLPQLRSIAKDIAKHDWATYLDSAHDDYFEEVMLQGMVIGYIKADIEEVLSRAEAFIPKINNWSVCDSFCITLKCAKKYPDQVWEFLQPYLQSDKEYDIRFAVVMLLNYYVDEAYIHAVLEKLDQIQHDGYYVKMAVAWAISICFIKYPEITMPYLQHNHLDKDTYNKALQKIVESNRISPEMKQTIRSMKRS